MAGSCSGPDATDAAFWANSGSSQQAAPGKLNRHYELANSCTPLPASHLPEAEVANSVMIEHTCFGFRMNDLLYKIITRRQYRRRNFELPPLPPP